MGRREGREGIGGGNVGEEGLEVEGRKGNTR